MFTFILSILCTASLLANLILIRIVKRMLDDFMVNEMLEEEISFIRGEADIPEEKIAQKFTNVKLLCKIVKSSNPDDEAVGKIVDTSLYKKNRVIGLTYIVPEQLFEEIKADYNSEDRIAHIKQIVADRLGQDVDDIDFADDIIEHIYNEVMKNNGPLIDDKLGTVTQPLLPHCTVYQLKDGRWVWRQEER